MCIYRGKRNIRVVPDKTGVTQGCVMSGFFFLLVIDSVKKKTKAGMRRGIRWNFTTTLEYLDFADDNVLLSSKFQNLNDKTKRMIEEASEIEFILNAKKCKTLRAEFAKNEDDQIVNNEPVEHVLGRPL